jgi:hypothetical protein
MIRLAGKPGARALLDAAEGYVFPVGLICYLFSDRQFRWHPTQWERPHRE